MESMKRMLGRLKDDGGAALIIALLMLTLMAILGLGAVYLASVDIAISGNEKSSIQAQYAAEAGIADGLAKINDPLNPPPSEPAPGTPWTAGDTAKDWHASVKRSVGMYNYSTAMSYIQDTETIAGDGGKDLKPNTPVYLYRRNFGYPKGPNSNTDKEFPVIKIISTATSPTGYQAKIEVEVTKYIVPINNIVKGAITANGDVKLQSGAGNIDGTNYLPDGVTPDPSMPNMPGINTQGTTDIAAGKLDQVVSGASTGAAAVQTNYDSTKRLYSLEDALGFYPEGNRSNASETADAQDFLGGSMVIRFTRVAGVWSPHEPGVADYSKGGIIYIDTTGDLGPLQILFTGILIVHNSSYVPEQWRVSTPKLKDGVTANPNYDTTHLSPFYNALLDHADAYTNAAYTTPYGPATLKNLNGTSGITGVLICDVGDKINGGAGVTGAVVSLASVDAGTDDVSGNGSLKYSSAAISNACKGGKGSINRKLSWKKVTSY